MTCTVCTYDQPHTHDNTNWAPAGRVKHGQHARLEHVDGSVIFGTVRMRSEGPRITVAYIDTSAAAKPMASWRADGWAVEIEAPPTPQPAPLPTEPGTLWLDKDGDLWRVNISGELVCLVTNDGIYKPPAALSAEAFAPFVRLEPRATTAKAVIDRLTDVAHAHKSRAWWEDLAEVAAEFGVTDA